MWWGWVASEKVPQKPLTLIGHRGAVMRPSGVSGQGVGGRGDGFKAQLYPVS